MRILRYEWRLLTGDRSLIWAGLLLALLTTYAVFNGARWERVRAAEVVEVVTAGDEAIAAEADRVRAAMGDIVEGSPPGRPGSLSYPIVLPPGPLVAFAAGQTDLQPYRAEANLFARADNLFASYQLQSPLSLLAGRFDLAFVITYLFPLLVIALTYNMIAIERERGTLALALAQPVTLQGLLRRKLVVRASLAAISVVTICGAALLASGSGGQVLRFGLWLAVALSYSLFWFGLSAVVNSIGLRSHTNAAILVCCWLALVLIVPTALNLALQASLPAPSRLDRLGEVRRADLEAQAHRAELLAEFFHEHPDLAADRDGAAADFWRWFFVIQREIEDAVRPLDDEFEAQLKAQQEMARRLQFISPALVAQQAFNDIAGTGVVRHWSFVEQARSFVGSWQDFMVGPLFNDRALTVAEFEALPRFRFQEEAASSVSRRVLPGILLLGGCGLLLVGVAIGRLRQYPVVR